MHLDIQLIDEGVILHLALDMKEGNAKRHAT